MAMERWWAPLLDEVGFASTGVVTPLMFEHQLIERAREASAHVVLPEGEEDRILQAAGALLSRGVARLTLLGNPDVVAEKASKLGVDVSGAEVYPTTEPELVERILVILGTPKGQRELNREDLGALRHCARVLAAGFPLVAFLQLVRVYAQSMRRIADAEVRLFHLYVHEPMIRDAVPELEMAEEMGELAADILRTAVAPTWSEIGQLAAIAALRTALNYFLQREIDGAERRATGAPPPAVTPARRGSA